MTMNPHHLAPCGLYCGVCAIWYADRDDNRKLKERLVDVYQGKLPDSDRLSANDIRCRGCLSDTRFLYCAQCDIRDCTQARGYQGCHQCAEFPCTLIDTFPMEVGKRVILRAVPHWRNVGAEQWVRDEEARYLCPQCGHKVFRGVRRCNRCKTELDLDG